MRRPVRQNIRGSRMDGPERGSAGEQAVPGSVIWPRVRLSGFDGAGGQSTTNYARLYRFGITPWERYATAAAASIAGRLDREETERSRPLGPRA